MNHSRRPQPLTLNSEPERPTWPRSAAKTPSWQVSEESTRIAVFAVANGTFSRPGLLRPQLGACTDRGS